MKKFAILTLWAGIGCINWGFTLGSFTHQFPYMQHESIAGLMAILGPFGAPAVVVCGGPNYHFLWKPKGTEERWQEFHKEMPNLDRDYFEQNYN